MLKRTSRSAIASGRFGISGTRISSTVEGRWVATIVLIRPMRAASFEATSADSPPRIFAQKKIAPSVAEVEPVGRQALNDTAAAARVARKPRRQLDDHAARAAETEQPHHLLLT